MMNGLMTQEDREHGPRAASSEDVASENPKRRKGKFKYESVMPEEKMSKRR